MLSLLAFAVVVATLASPVVVPILWLQIEAAENYLESSALLIGDPPGKLEHRGA
jgi:hypothetical protein